MNEITTLIESTKDKFNSALVDNSINFEAESGFALQSLSTDYARRLALSNKQSVIDAVVNISAIGISLNPAKKQAYLVPRDNKICLDISYMGLIDLAIVSGAIKWAQANVVYQKDNFTLQGYDKPPIHDFSPFDKDRGDIVGVYCVVKTPSGEYLTHTMTASEVYKIRDRSSQSFKGGKQSPWKTDEVEMIKKTCIKQAAKYWRGGDRLDNAIHYLNTDAGEGVDLIQPTRNPNLNKEVIVLDARELAEIIDELETCAQSGGVEVFKTKWKSLTQIQKEAVGIDERNRIKLIADEFTQNNIQNDEAN